MNKEISSKKHSSKDSVSKERRSGKTKPNSKDSIINIDEKNNSNTSRIMTNVSISPPLSNFNKLSDKFKSYIYNFKH